MIFYHVAQMISGLFHHLSTPYYLKPTHLIIICRCFMFQNISERGALVDPEFNDTHKFVFFFSFFLVCRLAFY